MWLGFTLLVGVLLVLDLGVLNRRSRALTPRQALAWSGGVVAISLLFGGFLGLREGREHALEYYTGYLIELTLSVDNLFVFILIFQYFAVPAALQPTVLKWGILGAIIMRGVMIAAGALLLSRFTWIIWVFGGILILTGIRMFRQDLIRIEPEHNPVVRLARRLLPFTRAYARDGRFLIRTRRGWVATPLVLVVLMIEWSDLVFAIDSIPAIFAVTRDPFIVYSSNVFAIIGLRALYLVLAGALDHFAYLKPGVALILLFVGIKMVVGPWVHIPPSWSLLVILTILGTAVAASLVLHPWRSQVR